MKEIHGIYRNGRVYLDSSVDWPDGMRVTVFRPRQCHVTDQLSASGSSEGNLAQQYFREIREAWTPFAFKYRIIPFCTAVFPNPSVVVIGTNHSDFDPFDKMNSQVIADRYASGNLEENTFLRHSHRFAVGLREWCSRACITIDETWIGTNRCAVQTGTGGIDELRVVSQFGACQDVMDSVLRRLLSAVAPRNVILTGKYAAALFYPHACERGIKFVDLKPRDEMLSSGFTTRLIPIEHPSRKDLPNFRDSACQRLADYFVR